MKKNISMILSVIFAFSLIPIAYAQGISGSGSLSSDKDEKTASAIAAAEQRLYAQYEDFSSFAGTDDYDELIHGLALQEVGAAAPSEVRSLPSFDDEMTHTLTKRGASGSSFTDFFSQNAFRAITGDLSTTYFSLQGSCSDGTHIFVSVLAKDSNGNEISTRLICAVWDSTANNYVFQNVTTNDLSFLCHTNDMAYNSYTGEIAILCCTGGKHNMLYTVPASVLVSNSMPSASDFTLHYISCNATSIDFNETLNCYFVGITTQNRFFARLDSDFNLIKTMGYKDANTAGWGRHTVLCDNRYIYCVNSFSTTEAVKKMRIELFTLSGVYVKTITFNCDDPDYHIEAETMTYLDGKLCVFVNYMKSKQNRCFCYVDISDLIFNIEFCSDETMSNHDTNKKQFVFRYIPTTLYQQRITNSGYSLVGWTAYRQEVNKWYYVSADGQTMHWYTEGSQPAGYTKYVYGNMQTVAQVGLGGEHVFMCAQWEPDEYYTIVYHSNGGTGTMSNQRIKHGMLTPLSANVYQKEGRTFQGWNAYWSEKNKWYYENISTGARGWYVEGREPDGYKKYVYTDGQSVRQTAYAGGHVYMYAVWNEYSIYYSVGNKKIEINYNDLLTPTTAVYAVGVANTIKEYTGYSGFQGWMLYRRERNTWYYVNNATGDKGWYAEGAQPSGYVKYVRVPTANTLGRSAPSGEHLILVAKWS